MTFTIGIPVRNGEAYLEHTLRSAIEQSRPADEILVIDDASSDRTREIARPERWGGRVRYVFNEAPSGFADAFNRLALHARSRYLVPICADDLLEPGCLAALETAFNAFPHARLCYVGFRHVDADGKPTGTGSPAPHCAEPRVHRGAEYAHRYLCGIRDDAPLHRCAGFAVDRELMAGQCAFRREAGLIADDDFFIRASALTDVAGIGLQLASVRMHAASISSRLDSLAARLSHDYMFQMRALEREPQRLPPEDREIYRGLTVRVLDSLFMESLKRGRRDLLEQALVLQRELDAMSSSRPAQLRTRAAAWRLAARGGVAHWLLRRTVSAAALARGAKRSIFGKARAPAGQGEGSSV